MVDSLCFLVRFAKLRKEELHTLYSSPDIIRQVKSRRMRRTGHVARMGEERKLYEVLVGKPEGKRPLERPSRRWEDGIRMDLGGRRLDSTGSGQGPVVGCCECGDEPSSSCVTELVRFAVDQVALKQDFVRAIRFSPLTVIPPYFGC
jgi:hypothetical protein